jgi:hypothetical protein
MSSQAPKRVQHPNRHALLGAPSVRKWPKAGYALWFFLTLLFATSAQLGCGGGSPSVSTPPPPPASYSVSLTWNGSTSAVTGYNVYRGTASGGPYMQINRSLITTTQYDDSNVQAGETYYYVVTSVNSSEIESTYSNQTSASVPGT